MIGNETTQFYSDYFWHDDEPESDAKVGICLTLTPRRIVQHIIFTIFRIVSPGDVWFSWRLGNSSTGVVGYHAWSSRHGKLVLSTLNSTRGVEHMCMASNRSRSVGKDRKYISEIRSKSILLLMCKKVGRHTSKRPTTVWKNFGGTDRVWVNQTGESGARALRKYGRCGHQITSANLVRNTSGTRGI